MKGVLIMAQAGNVNLVGRRCKIEYGAGLCRAWPFHECGIYRICRKGRQRKEYTV